MGQMPEIKVDSVRKIFDDGNHNAFTDMCEFRGNMYLTFRSCPDGHLMFTSSRIVVLTSKDGAEWRKIHSFNVPLRDVRDPHFLVFQDKLLIYTSTWLCNPATPGAFDNNDHLVMPHGHATGNIGRDRVHSRAHTVTISGARGHLPAKPTSADAVYATSRQPTGKKERRLSWNPPCLRARTGSYGNGVDFSRKRKEMKPLLFLRTMAAFLQSPEAGVKTPRCAAQNLRSGNGHAHH